MADRLPRFDPIGLAVGDESACYEVAGSMVVIGPSGLVAASSPLAINIKPTHLSQFAAFLTLPQTTQKSNREIVEFSRQWVRKHPIYLLSGPVGSSRHPGLHIEAVGRPPRASLLSYARSASSLHSSSPRG